MNTKTVKATLSIFVAFSPCDEKERFPCKQKVCYSGENRRNKRSRKSASRRHISTAFFLPSGPGSSLSPRSNSNSSSSNQQNLPPLPPLSQLPQLSPLLTPQHSTSSSSSSSSSSSLLSSSHHLARLQVARFHHHQKHHNKHKQNHSGLTDITVAIETAKNPLTEVITIIKQANDILGNTTTSAAETKYKLSSITCYSTITSADATLTIA